MTTGYRGRATTPDLDWAALERRVARLERELEERRGKAADRRAMVQFVGFSVLTGVFFALLVVAVGHLMEH